MSAVLSADILPRKRFTRAEVERMIDAGVLEDRRFELIDGDLIDKTGQKPPHSFTIRLVMKWLAGLFGPDRVQVQLRRSSRRNAGL